MQCQQCRADNRPGAQFCRQCGTRLADHCPACGATVVPGNSFCDMCGKSLPVAPARPSRFSSPDTYTPRHLVEKILTSRGALEGERKQVTVLFADVSGSMELLAVRDPEEARRLIDPILERMMEAVHRFEGTVNQVLGDGIMALFGAPLAHEDHALRACYAALAMQTAVRRGGDDGVRIRVGLNSGEVVVRAIDTNLHLDYSAVGQTTHLAARMEQMARPGTIALTAETLRLVEGYVEVVPLGPVQVKGLHDPVAMFELVGTRPTRSRLQVSSARGLTRFVGRDSEIEQLHHALELARSGHGQVVALVGEAGVGKSRLLWEFIRSDRCRGWLILESRSVSYAKATAYLPLIDLLKAYFQIEDQDDPRKIGEKVTGKLLSLADTLAPTLPALLSILGAPVDDPRWEALDPPQRRQRTLDAVRHLLLRESRIQPLLVLFEDLHWIDAETQALLDSLVEGIPGARLLLLVNYRPAYQHGWLNKSYYTQLRIDQLPAGSADALLEALLGNDPTLGPAKHLLIELAAGNPFFLEESVRTLVETHVLGGERGHYHLAQPLHAIQVPPTVQAMLAARIDRLSLEDKSLLQTAAVIGKDVPFPLLQAIAELSEDALRQGLSRVQAAEFLYEAAIFPEIEYTFKHAFTHDVAYGSLLHERRRALHARIVAAIERLYPDRLAEQAERVSSHALRGEVWDKAVIYLRTAGAKAMARSANRDAITYFEHALGALERLPESRETLEQAVDLRFDLRNAFFAVGELGRIFDNLQQAQVLAERLQDQRRLGWVAAYMCHYFWRIGDQAGAIASGHRALEIADAVGDFSLQMTNVNLGLAYYGVGDYPRAIECLRKTIASLPAERARERFGWAGMPFVTSRAYLAGCLTERGEFAEALAYAEEGVRFAEVAEHPFSLGQALIGLGVLHLRKGDLGQAVPVLEKGLELSRAGDVRAVLAGLESSLGFAYALAGRHEEGIALLEQGVQEGAARRITARQSLWSAWLSEALVLAGDRDRALKHATKALELSREHGTRGNEAHALRACGEVLAQGEGADAKRAEAFYGEAIDLAERFGMRPLVAQCRLGRGILYRRLGRESDALTELAAAASLLRAMGMTLWVVRAEAELARAGA
jgi:class 3 adenylate cyclase/tetratricopeptide (TPR) repeat protein